MAGDGVEMFHMITGGSGSGKSGYGERLLSQADAKKKFYIATMEVFGREAAKRVERHRQMRAGKGFLTIERPRGLEEIWLGAPSVREGGAEPAGRSPAASAGEHPAALLECMSNLVANELFGTPPEEPPGERNRAVSGERSCAADGEAVPDESDAALQALESRAAAAFLRIRKGILHVRDQCSLLIVVTNEVFSDGICHEPDTEVYIRLLGKLNAWMAGQADQVTEVVYGIPLRLK